MAHFFALPRRGFVTKMPVTSAMFVLSVSLFGEPIESPQGAKQLGLAACHAAVRRHPLRGTTGTNGRITRPGPPAPTF